MTRRATVLLLLLCSGVLPLSAQDVRTAVVPADLTVGDVFHAVVRVTGAVNEAAFPDSLILPPDLEIAGRRMVRQDTIAGVIGWSAVYPLTAWRTGEHDIPAITVSLPDGRSAAAAFPTIQVRSVLPADTAGVEPRPAKDVLGANRVWWPILVIAGLLLALAVALYFWYRRRRARQVEIAPIALPELPPRERALRALDAARTSGALEAAEFKRFYSDVSDALREYLLALDPALSLDLTTTELLQRTRRLGDAYLPDLRASLAAADLVKFARRRPERQTALDEWQRARRWVEQYQPQAPDRERAA